MKSMTSRRPRSISHSPLDAIIVIRKTINFKKKSKTKIKLKKIPYYYLGNHVPPVLASVAEPK